ncbi:MAG: hypothetical protein L0287_20525 [Anaerolineae bacterium]|nr:hypothetical protein [Anaerolineae bacterium]
MHKKTTESRRVLLAIVFVIIASSIQNAPAQELRWITVGQTQSFFMDYGNENELIPFTTTNFLAWPAQYGDNQYTTRAKGVWIGATNFYDPLEKKVKSVKVVGSGPRFDAANQPLMIFSNSIKLVGRERPPVIYVDNQTGSSNSLYDVLDEEDSNLPCDRMVVIKYNTSMGVSVVKKVLAFTQQNHDDYFVHDYVFKNTGIYNTAGDTIQQTINNFWVFYNYRYAFAGVTTAGGSGSTWGSFDSEWGTSTVTDDFGPAIEGASR